MEKLFNKKNFIRIILISIIIMFFMNTCVLATSEIISGMDPSGDTSNVSSSNIAKVISRIFTILQFIGTGFSIIAVMKLGISYMFSSIEQKAEIKKRAAPILIGSFLIVATVNILKIIQKVVTSSL